MPTTFVICQCSECRRCTTRDPDTNAVVPGVRVKPPLRLVHEQRDKGLLPPPRKPHLQSPSINADIHGLDATDRELVEQTQQLRIADTEKLVSRRDQQKNEHKVEIINGQVPVQEAAEVTQDPVNSTERNLSTEPNIYHELDIHEMEFTRRKAIFMQPTFDFGECASGILVDRIHPPPLQYSLNSRFLDHSNWLSHLLLTLDDMEVNADIGLVGRKERLAKEIKNHLTFLEERHASAWAMKRLELGTNDPSIPRYIDCSNYVHPYNALKTLPPTLLVSLVTTLILHLLGGLSQDASNFLLISLSTIVTSACATYARCIGMKDANPSLKDVAGECHWPFDIRTAIEQLKLKPNLVHFACCPSCSTLYSPSTDTKNSYPILCTYEQFRGGTPCGAQLVYQNNPARPIRPYMYQPPTSWLAQFVSRPGILDLLRQPTVDFKNKPPIIKTDVFHADAAREMLGADGKPFLDCPDGELRLAFNLNIDWFNPYGSKNSGRQYSVGGIYMVCMNLPTHLRYRVENVYLAGIIPGPSEPASDLSELDHFLRPLTDDFLTLYDPGVLLANLGPTVSAIAFLTRCIILALICDLPGFRKVAGFSGIKSHFICAFCRLTDKEKTNFDVASWPRWSQEQLVTEAMAWRNAANKSDRDSIFKKSGVRWSELWRLPYWNPTRHGVVDSMHNLFLGEVQRHCRHVWGMDRTVSSNKKIKPHSPEEQRNSLSEAADAIRNGKSNKLQSLRATYLSTIAADNSVHIPYNSKKPSKAEYAAALIEWYRKHPQIQMVIREPLPYPIVDLQIENPSEVILHREVLEEVDRDMANTTLPAWLAAPPRNIGSARIGKLKADTWRSFFSVSLVITLIRLWGSPDAEPRQRSLLQNFLALTTAIRWATSRCTSSYHTQIFEDQIQIYFQGLVRLFGPHKLVPNHHATLHLPECIKAFGPVHGWWTFPFERYNGIIQRFNTNSIPGQLERTFTQTFCEGSTLRAFVASDSSPEVLDDLKIPFNRYITTDFKATLLHDFLATQAEASIDQPLAWNEGKPAYELRSEVYDALKTYITRASPTTNRLPRVAQEKKKVHWKGVLYTTTSYSHKNSLIQFRPSMAGAIQEIFIYRQKAQGGDWVSGTFFAVKPFKELSAREAESDPYRKFPLLDIRICRNDLQPIVVISVVDIISHIATCNISYPYLGDQLMVVQSLNRDLKPPANHA